MQQRKKSRTNSGAQSRNRRHRAVLSDCLQTATWQAKINTNNRPSMVRNTSFSWKAFCASLWFFGKRKLQTIRIFSKKGASEYSTHRSVSRVKESKMSDGSSFRPILAKSLQIKCKKEATCHWWVDWLHNWKNCKGSDYFDLICSQETRPGTGNTTKWVPLYEHTLTKSLVRSEHQRFRMATASGHCWINPCKSKRQGKSPVNEGLISWTARIVEEPITLTWYILKALGQ